MKGLVLSIMSLTLFIMSSCNKSDNLSISVKDTDSRYQFSARYDRKKTIAVQQFVNTALKPNRIFADHEEELKKDIKLDDGSEFHLDSSLGDFVIEFEKDKNSDTAYENVKKLCKGVKEVIERK
jgi:hypothetical protein